jgi:hypothetical protein
MESKVHFDKRLLNLTSCDFLGTIFKIEWNEVVSNLTSNKGVDITIDPSKWNLENKEYGNILKLWKDANFNENAIKWTNYYPETHYSRNIDLEVCRYLRLDGCHRSWISRVDPGYFAPWHWDVDDNEAEYLKKGEIKRYSIFITGDNFLSGGTLGHIFILGSDYLYQCPEGSIFKWHNHREWHAGINAGLRPKFIYHILGY